MRRAKFGLVFCLLALTLFLTYTYFFHTQLILVIRDQETGNEYLREEVVTGDVLQLSWKHSVEQTSWLEKLMVNGDGTFKLFETRFQSFGAGVPNDKGGKVSFDDGYVVMSDLEEIHPSYHWIHSHLAKVTLIKNGNTVLLPGDIPHHHKVEMIIEKR